MNPNTDLSKAVDPDSPTSEGKFHNYRTNQIPWPVHLIWVLFWIGAVYYIVQYLLPALRVEIAPLP